MLRTHFLLQWFNLSDLAMEEAFFDTPLYRELVGLADNFRLPDQSIILRFDKTPAPRNRLEKHSLAVNILAEVNAVLTERGPMLKEGRAANATLISAPSSTKNKGRTRDPEMHFNRKSSLWYFGMTNRRRRTPAGRSSCEAGCGHEQGAATQVVHSDVDADSGLVHRVRGTSRNTHDVTQAPRLLHGSEKSVWAVAGNQRVEKRRGADADVTSMWLCSRASARHS